MCVWPLCMSICLFHLPFVDLSAPPTTNFACNFLISTTRKTHPLCIARILYYICVVPSHHQRFRMKYNTRMRGTTTQIQVIESNCVRASAPAIAHLLRRRRRRVSNKLRYIISRAPGRAHTAKHHRHMSIIMLMFYSLKTCGYFVCAQAHAHARTGESVPRALTAHSRADTRARCARLVCAAFAAAAAAATRCARISAI